MRLIQVISEYFPPIGDSVGGTQVHLRDLAAALLGRGHELEIFASLRGDEHDEYVTSVREWEGVTVTRVTNNFQDVNRLESMYANPKLDARFRAFLWGKEPDLVHFHHFTRLSTTLIDVCVDLGIPTVMTLHDYWMVCPRGKRYHPVKQEVCEELDRHRCLECLHPLWPTLLPEEHEVDSDELVEKRLGWYGLLRWDEHVRDVMGRLDLVLTPSRFHRERFVDWGLDPDRIEVVEHGIPTAALRAEPRGARPVRTIGFLGNVIRSKGPHVLVEAFDRLGRDDLVLEIHGHTGADHGRSDYAEALLSATPRDVRLKGPYDDHDLPRILAGIDVLVVPSVWWETFGLTAREGALAGIPVVVSNIGGLRDVVESGLALGFEPGDADDLARVLRRLVDDDELRERMSRKGELVRDIADCAAETEAHYEAVLDRAAAKQG